MGLGCAALTNTKSFPTYPSPLTEAQNGAGLSSPATAIALLGKGGATLMLVLLFMAVTSSTSAELIAVSSLLTFDVYKTYVKPSATSRQLVKISHYGIVLYAVLLAVFCCILNAVNINLTWLLTVLGVIVGGASIPVGLVLLWKRMSTVATIASPWIGLSFGLIAWFVTTSKRSGSITVMSSGEPINAVAGNIASWAGGALVAIVLSLILPKKFSSDDPVYVARKNKINGVAPTEGKEAEQSPTTESLQGDSSTMFAEEDRKGPMSAPEPEAVVPTGNEVIDFLEAKQIEPMDPILVRRGQRIAVVANVIFLVVAILLVPFTLFGTHYIFNKKFFTGWIVVSFMWVWVSSIICIVYPVVESTGALKDISVGVWRDLRTLVGGKGRSKKQAAEREV